MVGYCGVQSDDVGIQVGRSGGRDGEVKHLKIGVSTGSARSRPDGMGIVGASEAAEGRGRSDGQRRSRPWGSRRGVRMSSDLNIRSVPEGGG